MRHKNLLYSLRHLWNERLFSAINVIGLTLGATLFFLISLFVFHELSFDTFHKNSERIYRLWDQSATRRMAMTPYVWRKGLAEQLPEIEQATSIQQLNLTVRDGDRIFRESKIFAGDSLFVDVFDFAIIKGDRREILREPNKIAITPKTAIKYFGTDEPIGKTLEINLSGEFILFEINAIVECPANSHIQFDFLIPFELIREHSFNRSAYDNWNIHFVYTYLLMNHPFDPHSFKMKIKEYLREHGGQNVYNKFDPDIQALSKVYLHSNLEFDFEPKGSFKNVKILAAAALGLLLIAIVNFINLSTSQFLKRSKEVAVKRIMGSTKVAVVWQFLSESVILAIISSALSILVTILLIPYLNEFTGNSFEITHFLKVENFMTIILGAVVIGSLAGLYPALIVSRYPPAFILRSRAANRTNGRSARKVLVSFQFGMAVVLLIATGIIRKQVIFMSNKDLGFNQHRVIVIPDGGQISSKPNNTELLRSALKAYPKINEISASSSYPGFDTWSLRYRPEGVESDDAGISLSTIFADYSFIKTYSIPIQLGRDFNKDIYSDSNAFIINEAAIRLFMTSDSSWLSDPLGKQLESPFTKKKGPVIGVSKDFHFESLTREISPLIIQIHPEFFFNIQISIKDNDYESAIAEIRSKWISLFPEVPFNYRFMDQEFAKHFQGDEKLRSLLTIFTLAAILVAILGLFALSSLFSIEKAKEMSIRKVVGASERQVFGLLSWQFIRLILIGNLFGLPTAYFVMNSWLSSFAYRENMSYNIFLFSTVATVLVGMLTMAYHSYKTSRTNPVQVLQNE